MKKKNIIIGIVAGILCLVGLSGLRLITGWRPFKELQREDLYYVARITPSGTDWGFLDENEMEAFAERMQEMRAFPTAQDRDWVEALNNQWFVLEYAKEPGEMYLIKFWRGIDEYWVTVNEKIYEIRERTFEDFVAFLDTIGS